MPQVVLSRTELTLASLPAASPSIYPKNVQTRFTALASWSVFLFSHINPALPFFLTGLLADSFTGEKTVQNNQPMPEITQDVQIKLLFYICKTDFPSLDPVPTHTSGEGRSSKTGRGGRGLDPLKKTSFNLEGIMLSEINQIEKYKLYRSSLYVESKEKKLTEKESRLVVVGGGEGTG